MSDNSRSSVPGTSDDNKELEVVKSLVKGDGSMEPSLDPKDINVLGPRAAKAFTITYQCLRVINEFCRSGIFFIALGVAFLFIAGAYMGSEHSSFSFVTVVLGVAILLFGTGTQSVGRFQTNRAAAAMAGGAGVLTFCVAFGMIYFQDRIQSAFEVQKKYFILRLEPHDDGSSTFANFMARVTMNGVDIPVMKRGNVFLVYVPYLVTQLNSKPKFEYELHYVGAPPENASLNSRPHGAFNNIEIEVAKFPVKNAGYDFPVYLTPEQIDMRAAAPVKDAGKDAAPIPAEVPKNTPPIVFPSGGA